MFLDQVSPCQEADSQHLNSLNPLTSSWKNRFLCPGTVDHLWPGKPNKFLPQESCNLVFSIPVWTLAWKEASTSQDVLLGTSYPQLITCYILIQLLCFISVWLLSPDWLQMDPDRYYDCFRSGWDFKSLSDLLKTTCPWQSWTQTRTAWPWGIFFFLFCYTN